MEQTALDEGRTGLSWLLTGLQEPNYGQIQQTRARSLVKPFSRLSAPSWIPANVGYLRDLDFLEGRIKNVEKDGAKPTREKEYEAAPKPKAKWSNRRKRGKNDTSSRGAKKAERAEDQWPVAWQVHFVLLAGCLHSFAELLYVSTGRFCLYCDTRSGMLGNLARLDSTAGLTACPSPVWSEPRKAGTVSLSG